MAVRPTWQGYLRLSLVSCPVALYTATSPAGDVHFNMLEKRSHERIHMVPTDGAGKPVDRADIVKGYEIDKGRYVVVTDEEIKNVRLETTRALDIERFVDEADIDRLYWNDPYFLVPDGEMAVEAFAVIRDAMSEARKVALGRLVMHQRERLMALEPRDRGILAYTLRSHDEVRDPEEIFARIPAAKPPRQMVDIAARIIDQQVGDFDPSQFNDRYEEALRELIESKQKGKAVEAPEPAKAEVIDLMEALRRSLGDKGGKSAPKARARPPSKASESKPRARKSPARKRA